MLIAIFGIYFRNLQTTLLVSAYQLEICDHVYVYTVYGSNKKFKPFSRNGIHQNGRVPSVKRKTNLLKQKQREEKIDFFVSLTHRSE